MSDTPHTSHPPIEILIAEDSATQAEQLRYLLVRNHYNVLVANNGKEALARLNETSPALVISDIVMPEMNGYELCQRIKADENTWHIPVILLTSLSNTQDVVEGLACGADSFITKPYTEDYLLVHVERTLADKSLRQSDRAAIEVKINLPGKSGLIALDLQRMLSLLLSTYEAAVHRHAELVRSQNELSSLNDRLEELVEERTAALSAEITEHKKCLTALELSHDTLSHRNVELQDVYHAVSHELKTPLTSAREFASILLDGIAGPLTDDQTHYLQLIRESCDQLHFYVSDLLDATRLETGKLEVRPVDTSMETLVANVVSAMTSAMQAKGIELRREIDPALSSMPLDQRRIYQVCMNLLNNALKYTPAGGVVTVRVRTDPDDPEGIQFSVRDTGRGIAPEHLDRIFDKLYQVRETDTSIEGGMGLGLYIASEIVRLHGGRIWVESTVGGGSIFYFTVPKRARAPRHHILFVDDDTSTQEMARATLEPVGFEVSVASDGGTALEIVRGRAVDLAIVDLCLPGMPSPVLMGELRNTRGDLPLVLYTGYPDSQLMMQAMKFSPLTLLTKPCPPEKLIATVRAMLAERAPSIKPDHPPRAAA